MYVCMYVCMYVRTYVCMYVCTYVCTYVYVCMYAHSYVCTYICIIWLTRVAEEIIGTTSSTAVKLVSSSFNLPNRSSTMDKRS